MGMGQKKPPSVVCGGGYVKKIVKLDYLTVQSRLLAS